MRKFLHIGMWILTMLLMTGCTKFEPQSDAVSIDKKGQITRAFVDDSFVDESNQPYDVEEIQAMMEDELETYNSKFGVDHITLEKCVLEDGVLTIQIICDQAKYYQDYCSYFNDDYTTEEDDVEFFAGTVGEASDFDFKASFQTADGESADASQVLANKKYKVVVLNEPIEVRTPGAIQYVSDNVEMLGKKQAKVQESDQLERAYIIYK